MPRFPFAFAVILATTALGRADILPPGAKWAKHVAKFDGIAQHQADYAFYIYPRDLARGTTLDAVVPVPLHRSRAAARDQGAAPLRLRREATRAALR